MSRKRRAILIVAVLTDLSRTNRADRSAPLLRHLNDGGEFRE